MLKKMAVGPYQANCYILGCNKTMQGVVIDPGDEVSRIVKEISRAGIRIGRILITHGHFDHTGGSRELRDITGAPVWIHALDASKLGFTPDGDLFEGQEIDVKPGIAIYNPPGKAHKILNTGNSKLKFVWMYSPQLKSHRK